MQANPVLKPNVEDREALDTIAEWMANLAADPSLSVAEAAPEHGVAATGQQRRAHARVAPSAGAPPGDRRACRAG